MKQIPLLLGISEHLIVQQLYADGERPSASTMVRVLNYILCRADVPSQYTNLNRARAYNDLVGGRVKRLEYNVMHLQEPKHIDYKVVLSHAMVTHLVEVADLACLYSVFSVGFA